MDMGWKTSVPCFPRRKSLWSFSARCPDELESVSHGIFVVVVVIVKMLSFGDDSLVSCIRDNSGHSHSLAAIGAWGGVVKVWRLEVRGGKGPTAVPLSPLPETPCRPPSLHTVQSCPVHTTLLWLPQSQVLCKSDARPTIASQQTIRLNILI